MVLSEKKLISPQSLGRAAWFSVQTIAKTLSIEKCFADNDFQLDCKHPVIYVLWHGRLFIPLICLRNTGIIALVSDHRDGEIITATLVSAGYNTVRGSTTRGGIKALAKLVRHAKKGASVGFTPDGPRGPRCHFKPGAVFVAAKTGLPVVPLAGSANRAYYLKSWDSFQIPLPFSRVVFCIGEPYYVSGGSDPENIEFHRAELEKRLIELTSEADEIVGASVKR